MQLATKLWKLYTAPSNDVHEFQEDAGICLYLIASQSTSFIPVEDCRYIAQHLHEKQPTDPGANYYMYLIFQLDIIGKQRDLCAPHFQHLYEFWLANLQLDQSTPSSKLHALFGVRVLTNVFAMSPAAGELHLDFTILVNALNQLFVLKDAPLTKELLQLVKNLMELRLLDNALMLEHLKVYA